tara:strand:+ start:52 stop:327 length:276 start_codon:yes stop_codon:yes gene_type:complete
VEKISVIKKNGLPLNEQDKKNFRDRLAIVCFQLGFVIVEEESLPSITAEDLESLPEEAEVIDDVGQKYDPTLTKEDLQISRVNPNCEVCDD